MPGWVVVNADDLGVSQGATLGILDAHQHGIVTSASLAVTTPFYRHAVDACVRLCPALGVGLHFTLTSGQPAARPEHVPLLVDEKGFFRQRFTSLFRAMTGAMPRALTEQIEIELEAQLARLHADSIPPDHIDSERHIHLIPGIFECVAAAAERHRVPFVRAGAEIGHRFLRVEHMPGIALRGGLVKSLLLSALSRRARTHLRGTVLTADYVASYLHTGRMDLIVANVLAATPESAVVEMIVHPGIPEESRGIDLGNRELERYLVSMARRRELEACLRPSAERDRLRLTNFTQLAAKERSVT